MSDDKRRLQEILATLVSKRIAESLGRVEDAIAAWRDGEKDVLEAHSESLRHAARANSLSSRVARAGLDGPASLLRDAFDLGIIGAAEFERLAGRKLADVASPPALDSDASAPDAKGPMPEKRSVLTSLLSEGAVLIHLDARRAHVDVPKSHRKDLRLVLRVGYDLHPAIPDLSFDEKGVRATLTFRGTPHRCSIPWAAIYALVAEDGRGLVWPDSVPPEVAKDFADADADGDGDGDGDDDFDVPDVDADLPDPGDDDPQPPKPKPSRGHLKLV